MPSLTALRRSFESANPLPDFEFRLAAGVYLGTVATGGTSGSAVVLGVGDAGAVLMVAIATFLAVTVAGAFAVGRWRYAPERVGGSSVRYWLLAPVVPFIAAAGFGGFVGLADGAVFAWAFSGMLTFFAGIVVAMMARTRYVVAVFDDEMPLVSWRAETAPGPKRRRVFLAVGIFVLGGIGFVVDVLFDAGYANLLPGLAGIAGGLLGGTIRSESHRAHDAGIEIDGPVYRGFVPWERFEGFEVTEAEIRLLRRRRPDYRYDRSAIDDPETVVDVLRRYVGE